MTDQTVAQPGSTISGESSPEACTDEQLVGRILAGNGELFGIIMRRYATRLYRITLSVLRDPAEAEDVVQDAYIRAYEHLDQFAGRAKFATWLCRIAVNEAIARRHRNSRYTPLDLNATESDCKRSDRLRSLAPSPYENVAGAQMFALAATVIQGLPEHYRLIVFMRDIREFDVAQTAELLGLSKQNVKVRLHRAHAAVRRELYRRVNAKNCSAHPRSSDVTPIRVERELARCEQH